MQISVYIIYRPFFSIFAYVSLFPACFRLNTFASDFFSPRSFTSDRISLYFDSDSGYLLSFILLTFLFYLWNSLLLNFVFFILPCSFSKVSSLFSSFIFIILLSSLISIPLLFNTFDNSLVLSKYYFKLSWLFVSFSFLLTLFIRSSWFISWLKVSFFCIIFEFVFLFLRTADLSVFCLLKSSSSESYFHSVSTFFCAFLTVFDMLDILSSNNFCLLSISAKFLLFFFFMNEFLVFSNVFSWSISFFSNLFVILTYLLSFIIWSTSLLFSLLEGVYGFTITYFSLLESSIGAVKFFILLIVYESYSELISVLIFPASLFSPFIRLFMVLIVTEVGSSDLLYFAKVFSILLCCDVLMSLNLSISSISGYSFLYTYLLFKFLLT